MPEEGLSSYIDLLLATYPSVGVWFTPSEQEKARSEILIWVSASGQQYVMLCQEGRVASGITILARTLAIRVQLARK
jgi:hypothetical protein